MNNVAGAIEDAANWVKSDGHYPGTVVSDSEYLHLVRLIQEVRRAVAELRALYEVEWAARATCRLAMNDGQATPKSLSNALAKLDELRKRT